MGECTDTAKYYAHVGIYPSFVHVTDTCVSCDEEKSEAMLLLVVMTG